MKKTIFADVSTPKPYVKHSVVFLFIMLYLNCYFSRAEAGCSACEQRRNPTKEINSLPYVITKPGKYLLQPQYSLYPDNMYKALITIQSDDVWLDLKGNALNLQGHQGAGIIIEGRNNVHIMHGSILNSNLPSSLQENTVSTSYPVLTSSTELSDLIYFTSSQFATPYHSCVGIALMPGSNNIKIQNIVFNQLFIGIAGIDEIHYVEISQCTGIDCGNSGSLQEDGSSSLKGGFVVIAPSQPIESTLSSHITLRNCKASGQAGLFGVALFNCRDSLLKNFILQTPASDNVSSATAGLVAILCQDCTFHNILDVNNQPCAHVFSCRNCYANP
jgi:hypothetical protein